MKSANFPDSVSYSSPRSLPCPSPAPPPFPPAVLDQDRDHRGNPMLRNQVVEHLRQAHVGVTQLRSIVDDDEWDQATGHVSRRNVHGDGPLPGLRMRLD